MYLREEADKTAFESENAKNLEGIKGLITELNVLKKSAIVKETKVANLNKAISNLGKELSVNQNVKPLTWYIYEKRTLEYKLFFEKKRDSSVFSFPNGFCHWRSAFKNDLAYDYRYGNHSQVKSFTARFVVVIIYLLCFY